MVRILGGQFKGLSLVTPPSIRATSAKVRQALFNILEPVVDGARVLDVFAGSGAFGCEALSRGASFAAFIDADTESVLSIRENLQRLAEELPRTSWRVVHQDAEAGIRTVAGSGAPFDLIMLDPPYRSEEGKKALNAVVDCAILAPSGIVAVEHDQRTVYPIPLGPLRYSTQHRYGDTVLSLYSAHPLGAHSE